MKQEKSEIGKHVLTDGLDQTLRGQAKFLCYQTGEQESSLGIKLDRLIINCSPTFITWSRARKEYAKEVCNLMIKVYTKLIIGLYLGSEATLTA